jgi:hypothetical protein
VSCGASAHADVVSYDGREDVERMSDSEKLPNRLADVDQFQIALKAVMGQARPPGMVGYITSEGKRYL